MILQKSYVNFDVYVYISLLNISLINGDTFKQCISVYTYILDNLITHILIVHSDISLKAY